MPRLQFLFTRLPGNGHLVGFQFFAIMNKFNNKFNSKCDINIYEQLMWSHVLLHKYLGMGFPRT